MVQVDKEENMETMNDAIAYLEHRGFENIKADTEGFETPKSYHKKDSDVSITPDIVAERNGIKHYFEISLKSEKPKLLKSKWRFLEVFTRLNKHRFKIMTRKGHYSFTEKMMTELNLEKKLIKLS